MVNRAQEKIRLIKYSIRPAESPYTIYVSPSSIHGTPEYKMDNLRHVPEFH